MLRSGARERPTPTEARNTREARDTFKQRICDEMKIYKCIWNRQKSCGNPELAWALISSKIGTTADDCKREYKNIRKIFQSRINKVLSTHPHFNSWEEILNCVNDNIKNPVSRSRNLPEVWINNHEWLGKAIAEEILENRRDVGQLDVLEELLGESSSPTQAETIADPDLQAENLLLESGGGEAVNVALDVPNNQRTAKARAPKRRASSRNKRSTPRKKLNITIVPVVLPASGDEGAQSQEVTVKDVKIEFNNDENKKEFLVIKTPKDVPLPPTVDPSASQRVTKAAKKGRPKKQDNFEEQVKLKLREAYFGILESLYINNLGIVPSQISRKILDSVKNKLSAINYENQSSQC